MREPTDNLPNKMVCQICWTCRGVIFIPRQQTDDVATICDHKSTPIRHYVCDQQDYMAMKQLKHYLDVEINFLLKSKSLLLEIGFSAEFLNALIQLSSRKLLAGKGNNLLTKEEEEKVSSQCETSQDGHVICKLCRYQTKHIKIMLKHLSSHNNGKEFVCQDCKFSTLFRRKWKLHRCRKPDKSSVTCEKCGESFPIRVRLDHHMITKHSVNENSAKVKVFECPDCDYIGRNSSELTAHRRKHTGDYLSCPHDNCDFRSPHKQSLHNHLRHKHAPEKSHCCTLCTFQSKHASSLRGHMRLHTDCKKFKCDQCSYSSYTATDLRLHIKRKHLKDEKYSCPKCSFETNYSFVLKKHIIQHDNPSIKFKRQRATNSDKTGMKEFNCSFCNRKFMSMASVVRHMDKCDKVTFKPIDTNVCGEFEERELYFQSGLSSDLEQEVYDITRGMVVGNNESGGQPTFTSIVQENPETDAITCKGRNPMLGENTQRLEVDRDSPLLEDSLFNLMSDFPRPPTLNRCQSASILMFTSLSPHLTDRPLTPDFFSENPASSFFQSFSRNLDTDQLTPLT